MADVVCLGVRHRCRVITLAITGIALAIIIFVWCFIGLSRDLNRLKLFTVWVRWKSAEKGASNQVKTVIEFPDKKIRGLDKGHG